MGAVMRSLECENVSCPGCQKKNQKFGDKYSRLQEQTSSCRHFRLANDQAAEVFSEWSGLNPSDKSLRENRTKCSNVLTMTPFRLKISGMFELSSEFSLSINHHTPES